MPLLFGPVLSRRLGRSLGLELVPRKVCNMDCLYCEVGRTTNFTTERKPYLSFKEIEDSLGRASQILDSFDVLTITGSGEPTLNLYFEETVALAKKLIKKPLAVLTNSSLVHLESVREALAKVDFVLASLDSARKGSFLLVNRPIKGIKLELMIEGLKTLREEMLGELWLEILLVKGLNDSPEDISTLRAAIEYINPHRIQLNTVIRPPAYPVAKALTYEELKKVKELLSLEAEIISAPEKVENRLSRFSEKELLNLLVAYLTRRPAPLTELVNLFEVPEEKLNQLLGKLESQGKVSRVEHAGCLYFRA